MIDNEAEEHLKVSKQTVSYRPAPAKHHCGNCVMFHHNGTCDLVKGQISSSYVCDRWEAK